MEAFTIRDFSGGLNTAMDEANLPPSMTASLYNVDFLDSKALRRRNGYALLTASSMSESPVKSIYRYYQKDGDAYWVVVSGTSVYMLNSAPGSDLASLNVEAETNYISASSSLGVDVVYGSAFSGGAAVGRYPGGWDAGTPTTPITATLAISLPAFSSADFKFKTVDTGNGPPATLTATMYINIGASSFTVPVVSATATSLSYTVTKSVNAGTAYIRISSAFNGIEDDQGWNWRTQLLDNVVIRSSVASSPFTEYSVGLSATANTFAFATYNDKCYLSSAYDTLMSSVGATFTTVTATNTPSVAFLAEKSLRLFGAGSASDTMKLYYTELDDPEDWGTGTQNGIYLGGKDSGQGCTGLAVANDLLYFFTETSTYALEISGPPEAWAAKTLSTVHGCVAPGSIAVAPNGVIFLAGDGVRSHGNVEGVYSDDGSVFAILSDNISPTLRSYTDDERTSAQACIYNNRYWLSIGGDVYVCDLEKRTENGQPPWTMYSGIDANCFHVTRSDEYGIHCGGASAGNLYRLDTGGTDNGEAISMFYKTPPIAPKGYTSKKHFRHTHIAAESSTSQSLSVSLDTDDVSSAAQDVLLDASTDIQPKRLLTPARGRSAQITLSSDGLEQPLTVSELTVTYNPVPRVR